MASANISSTPLGELERYQEWSRTFAIAENRITDAIHDYEEAGRLSPARQVSAAAELTSALNDITSKLWSAPIGWQIADSSTSSVLQANSMELNSLASRLFTSATDEAKAAQIASIQAVLNSVRRRIGRLDEAVAEAVDRATSAQPLIATLPSPSVPPQLGAIGKMLMATPIGPSAPVVLNELMTREEIALVSGIGLQTLRNQSRRFLGEPTERAKSGRGKKHRWRYSQIKPRLEAELGRAMPTLEEARMMIATSKVSR